MDAYWLVIGISNILFFSALMWLNQTNKEMFEALLKVSGERGVYIVGLSERITKLENNLEEDDIKNENLKGVYEIGHTDRSLKKAYNSSNSNNYFDGFCDEYSNNSVLEGEE